MTVKPPLPQTIRLRPLSESDKSQAFLWRNDPSIYKWCRQAEPISLDHHREYWARVEKDPHTRMYGVVADDVLVGVCGLTSIDWINRRAEFSLYIGPEHQGKGLGKLALETLCRHGFDVLNLNLIWGEAFEGNPALDTFQKVGFIEEGRRRQFYYREGNYVDAILFSLTRYEFAGSNLLAGTDSSLHIQQGDEGLPQFSKGRITAQEINQNDRTLRQAEREADAYSTR